MFTTIYGPHHLLIAITVGVTLVGVVLWGTLAGSMLVAHVGHVAVGRPEQDRLRRLSAGRHLVQDGQVEVTVQAERQGAHDGARREGVLLAQAEDDRADGHRPDQADQAVERTEPQQGHDLGQHRAQPSGGGQEGA